MASSNNDSQVEFCSWPGIMSGTWSQVHSCRFLSRDVTYRSLVKFSIGLLVSAHGIVFELAYNILSITCNWIVCCVGWVWDTVWNIVLISGFSPYTPLLDRVESEAIHLIGDPSLTLTLDSLSLSYQHYFGHYSDALAACVLPPMTRPHSTRQASIAHSYCVELSNARINWFRDGFFPSTSRLWNSAFFYISGFLQKAGLSPP